MIKHKPNIIVVDDEPDILSAIKGLFRREYNVVTTTSPIEALNLIKGQKDNFPVILTDQRMPEMQGYELLNMIYEINKNITSIIVSGYTDKENLIKSINDAHIFAFIPKPWDPDELKLRVTQAFEIYFLKEERIKRNNELLQINQVLGKKIIEKAKALSAFNKRYFDEYLEQEWRRAKRCKTSIALIMIEIDLFEQYNATYGHIDSANCLLKVEQTMSLCIRRPADMLAQYEGGKFACLLPETDIKEALFIAQNLRQSVIELGYPHLASPISILSISVGTAALIPTQEMSLNVLLELADNNLSDAKKNPPHSFKATFF